MKNIVIGAVCCAGILTISWLLLQDNDTTTLPPTASAPANNTVPATFASFPIYPGATVSSVSQQSGEHNAENLSLSLTTSDTVTAVNDWYAAAFTTNSWNLKSDQVIAGYRLIQGERDNHYSSMQATRSGDTTTISQQMKIRATR